MGYHIQYGKTIVRTAILSPSIDKKKRPIWILILLVITVLGYTIQSNRDILRDYILPGDPEITAAAFGSLVDGIRQGENFGDAVTAFCLEIIENANISE